MKSADTPTLSLRSGETILDSFESGTARLSVTTQRVLVSKSGSDTVDRSIELPNVERVASTRVGGTRFRYWGGLSLLFGLPVFLAGWFLPWDTIVPEFPLSVAEMDALATMGTGWALDMLRLVYSVGKLIDTLLAYTGAIAMSAGVLSLGIWLLLRRSVLIVQTAEDPHLEIPELEHLAESITAAISEAKSNNYES